MARPNVILAGDAAGIEPALGGGIHLALSYGEVAAQALVQAFQKGDFSFQTYKQRVGSHYLGQHIKDAAILAQKIYSGEGNPLDHVREFFTERIIRRKLRALLQGQGG